MPLDLTEVWETNNGFTYPNYDRFWELLNAQADPDDTSDAAESLRTTAYDAFIKEWMNRLVRDAGDGYHSTASEQFVMVTNQTPKVARDMLRLAHLVDEWLTKNWQLVVEGADPGMMPILMFEDIPLFARYFAHFVPEGAEVQALPAAAFIPSHGRHAHIVGRFVDFPSAQHSIAHELTHARLAHLELPLWLEEGLTQIVDRGISGMSQSPILDREMRDRHYAYWNEETIQTFWSYKGFTDPEASELSYSLSRILVSILLEERKQEFAEFVLNAHRNDCGESAAVEFLESSLGDLATVFLGEGNWAPVAVAGLDDSAAEPA